jgi:hypothetical protein
VDEKLPALVNFGTCYSCGERVGWVTVPGGKNRPLNPEPRIYGEFGLLRDGRHAVPLPPGDSHEGPRFVCHFDTCDPKGLRKLDYLARSVVGLRPLTPSEQLREKRRQAKLAAERSRS